MVLLTYDFGLFSLAVFLVIVILIWHTYEYGIYLVRKWRRKIVVSRSYQICTFIVVAVLSVVFFYDDVLYKQCPEGAIIYHKGEEKFRFNLPDAEANIGGCQCFREKVCKLTNRRVGFGFFRPTGVAGETLVPLTERTTLTLGGE